MEISKMTVSEIEALANDLEISSLEDTKSMAALIMHKFAMEAQFNPTVEEGLMFANACSLRTFITKLLSDSDNLFIGEVAEGVFLEVPDDEESTLILTLTVDGTLVLGVNSEFQVEWLGSTASELVGGGFAVEDVKEVPLHDLLETVITFNRLMNDESFTSSAKRTFYSNINEKLKNMGEK